MAALTAGRAARVLGTGPAIIASAAVIGPGLVLVPLAPASHSIPFLIAGLAIAAYGGVTYNITALSYMQATTPDQLLGRMNATRDSSSGARSHSGRSSAASSRRNSG